MCQYHAVMIVITLQYILKLGSIMSLVLFFLLNVALATEDFFLMFYVSYTILYSPRKEVIDTLIKITLKL